jgi:thiamine biosynthesis lipoprotein
MTAAAMQTLRIDSAREGTSGPGRTVRRTRFRAMSTDVEVVVVGGSPGLEAWAQDRVEHLERRWSRFRPDSEISTLNRAEGEPVHVSAETIDAVRSACAAWVFTDGTFDPTVHDSLLRLGYDESIDEVRQRTAGRSAASPLPAPGCAGIVLDDGAGVVQLPAGVRLDLGGIGKGLAADDVATGLLARGAAGAMVNIGGDVRVAGSPSRSEAWRVEIEDPRHGARCATIRLLDGGVATSTTLRRRWRSTIGVSHHLLDPATGACTPDDAVVGVSVVAGTAGWADALSKVPFVVGHAPQGAFGAATAIVFRASGAIETVGSLATIGALEPAVPA